MAAPKRSKDQVLADRVVVARLYLHGWPQAEIARHLNAGRPETEHITQQTIAHDMKAIRSEWKRSALFDFNDRIGQELARLDEVERTAWAAWQRSTEQTEKTMRKSSRYNEPPVDGKGTPLPYKRPGSRYEAQVVTEQNIGNPRFLEIVQRCCEQRCRLLGLDAPMKVATTTTDGRDVPDATTTREERVARALALLDAARARRDGDTAAGASDHAP